jgi:hypothetical protein
MVTETMLKMTSQKHKGKGTAVPVHAMKAYRGVDVQLHSFLMSELDGGKW